MIRVVVDTNVLIASINREMLEYGVYKLFNQRRFDWVVSTEILNEYQEGIEYLYAPETADFVIEQLCTARNVIFEEPFFKWNLNQDKDDNKFSDLAISHNAVLVTKDKGFNVFNGIEFPKLKVYSPQEFLKFSK